MYRVNIKVESLQVAFRHKSKLLIKLGVWVTINQSHRSTLSMEPDCSDFTILLESRIEQSISIWDLRFSLKCFEVRIFWWSSSSLEFDDFFEILRLEIFAYYSGLKLFGTLKYFLPFRNSKVVLRHSSDLRKKIGLAPRQPLRIA